MNTSDIIFSVWGSRTLKDAPRDPEVEFILFLYFCCCIDEISDCFGGVMCNGTQLTLNRCEKGFVEIFWFHKNDSGRKFSRYYNGMIGIIRPLTEETLLLKNQKYALLSISQPCDVMLCRNVMVKMKCMLQK
jgi:hypothetical protein